MPLLFDWLESLSVDVQVSSGCSRLVSPMSTCTVCLDHCSQNAISFRKKSVEIDPSLCNRCGHCVIACPTSALVGNIPSRKIENGRLHYDSSSIPITSKELLLYFSQGLKCIVVDEGVELNHDWENTLIETNDILECLNEPPLSIEKNEYSLSRRELLFSFRKKGKRFVKEMTPATWRIQTDGFRLSTYFPDKQFYQVDIHLSDCTLCQTCFSLCPEKLFALAETDLQINNQQCTNCSLCIDICPEKAISVKSSVKDKVVTTHSAVHKQCPTCLQSFLSFDDKEKCHVCLNRDINWL
jgi:ferredoxin